MKDIPGYSKFAKIEALHAGLSSDEKYCVETGDGQKSLLRISDISEYEHKRTLFNMMKLAAAQEIPMCFPIDFGRCNGGKSVYQRFAWRDGKNLEEILPLLPETKQYSLGLKAGEILQKIHSIPAPDNLEDWSVRYLRVNENRMKSFCGCDVKIKETDAILDYFEHHKHLLKGREQCLHHGDYHTGNLLVTDSLNLSVIDWELLDYDNYGDPWEEFNRIGISDVLPHFSTGLINGYFRGKPPEAFWCLLALYLSAGALMLVSWAYYTQKEELDYSINHIYDVLQWFDNMKNPIPAWYLPDMYQ